MITSDQIRAARALIRLDQADLAAAAGVSVETIKRIERAEGSANAQLATLANIQRALELKGVVFITPAEEHPGGAGVRLALDPDELLKTELIEAAKDAARASMTAALMNNKRITAGDIDKVVAQVSEHFSFLFSRNLHVLLKR